MENKIKIFEKEYEIHYYEVDYRKKALITSLVDFLGDIATCQSETLGVGIDYLKENNLGWVLYKWNIDIKEYPRFGDKIIIRTWPYAFRKFYAYRKFEIVNSKGETIGTADSIWFLINTEKRRPIRIGDYVYNAYGIETTNDRTIEIEDIKKLEEVNREKVFDVRYSDIDTNKHVNNVKYISWAIETIPQDIILNYVIENLKVTYTKETLYGETIRVLTEIKEEDNKIVCTHKIVDNENKELTLLQSLWVKK